ncbi:hypothetical protein ACIBCB_14490 [Streptomyces uncialis]|nr:hypothetical protein [Streptomyces uncialis]
MNITHGFPLVLPGRSGCNQCIKAGELRFNCFRLGHLQSRHIHEQAELP